jgi:hypothetical protein
MDIVVIVLVTAIKVEPVIARIKTMNKAEFFKKVNSRLTKYNPTKTTGNIPREGSSTKDIPSLGDGVGNATAKPIQEYTGDEMIGIGQLHKSNAIPVFRDNDIKDLGKMRR